jgi:hypothetical protein
MEAADYLAHHYNGNVITVKHGYCPSCFIGGDIVVIRFPTKKAGRAATWRKLFNGNTIDPVQVLSSFIPSTQGSVSQFREDLLNLLEPGALCGDRQDCAPCCLLCKGTISPSDKSMQTVGGPHFPVHERCLTACSYVPDGKGKQHRCKALVPTLPMYIQGVPPVLCKAHARLTREAGRSSAATAAPGSTQQRQRYEPPLPSPQRRQPSPPRPAPHPPPPLKQPPQPTKRAPERRPTKLEKTSEHGRSHNIVAMLGKRGEGPPRPAESPHGSKRPCVVFTPHAHCAQRHSPRVLHPPPTP